MRVNGIGVAPHLPSRWALAAVMRQQEAVESSRSTWATPFTFSCTASVAALLPRPVLSRGF